jgi:hypothetical protein
MLLLPMITNEVVNAGRITDNCAATTCKAGKCGHEPCNRMEDDAISGNCGNGAYAGSGEVCVFSCLK